MSNVPAHSHTYAAGQSLEDTLDKVMFILPMRLYVKIHLGRVGQTLEEMFKHLGGNISYTLPMEFHVPHEPRSTSKVDGYLTQTIIHRQTEPIPFYASLVAKGLS